MRLAIFFLSFFHVPPWPPNLCTKAVVGNVGKELHLKEKMAPVVLLWASLRGLMSVNMTAWVGDNVACKATCHWPRIGTRTGLVAHRASPCLNWSPMLAMIGSTAGEGLPLPGTGVR